MLDFKDTFEDAKGREWRLSIPFGTYLQLKEKLELNIEDLIVAPKSKDKDAIAESVRPLEEFLNSDQLPVAVWVILEKEATAVRMTKDDFFMSLNGQSIEGMGYAFMRAAYDFFRSPLKRLLMEDMATKAKAATEMMTKKWEAEMPRTTAAMLRSLGAQIDREIQSQASSESVGS